GAFRRESTRLQDPFAHPHPFSPLNFSTDISAEHAASEGVTVSSVAPSSVRPTPYCYTGGESTELFEFAYVQLTSSKRFSNLAAASVRLIAGRRQNALGRFSNSRPLVSTYDKLEESAAIRAGGNWSTRHTEG